jgi:glycerol-3-phosphate dehydrogenase (NAD(P)+)
MRPNCTLEKDGTTMKIAIIGDGGMGTACAFILNSQGHDVRLFSFFPEHVHDMIQCRENRRFLPDLPLDERITLTADPELAFDRVAMIVHAVPVIYSRTAWGQLKPVTPEGVPIVSVAKGIETGTLMRPTQILRDVLADERPLVALSGPSIAPELAKCLPATVVVASEDEQIALRTQKTFSTDWFRVYTNTDVLGVEIAGATKNIIAVAAGICDGLMRGHNSKAALITRGLVEITRLGAAMGARRETFAGLAGMGDLITTCFSPVGRNRTVGERIGRGEKLDEITASMGGQVAEGPQTCRAVAELAEKYDVDMPITHALHAILFEDKDVIEAISELMTRRPKPE